MTGSPPPVRAALFLICLLLVLGSPSDLRGHARTVSYSTWTFTSTGWDVQVRLPVLELDRRFGKGRWNEDSARSFALEQFRASTGEGPCAVEGWSGERKQDVFATRWALRCPGSVRSLSLDAFFDTAPSHLHLARVHAGGKTLEQVVTAAAPALSLVGKGPGGFAVSFLSGLGRFLGRPAHLFCLAGLVLLASSRRSLMKITAVFVPAASVPITLLSLGLVRSAPRSVEAMIGLSVFMVAVELFIRWSPPGQAGRWRLVLGGTLLCTALLALLGWLPVSPLALLGAALISLSLSGLRGPSPSASIPWILAGTAGLIHGMGFSGAGEIFGPGHTLKGTTGFILGAVSGVLLAAAGLYIVFSKLVPPGEREPLRKGGLQGPVVASVLMAAGTYWFVECALNPF